jgi:hypothetical protein
MSFQVRKQDPVRPPDSVGAERVSAPRGAEASSAPTVIVTSDHAVRNILLATGLAFVVASVLLVVAVLPAEYGFDPLRTGRLLGLTALADTGPRAIGPQTTPYKVDSTQFELGPFEFVEYKYRLDKDAAMIFSWQATGPVIYDFHSEPDGAPKGFAQSFDRQQAAQAHGTYTAPFPGIHGWFWENPGVKTVRIKLTTAGFYTAAQEFKDNDSSFHALTEIARPSIP